MLSLPLGSKLYIAGGMSGLPDHNYPAFNRAAKMLRDMGYEVFNPAETDGGDTSKPRAYYISLDVVMISQVDAVYFLKGWIRSEGAKLELSIACQREIPIFFEQGFTT